MSVDTGTWRNVTLKFFVSISCIRYFKGKLYLWIRNWERFIMVSETVNYTFCFKLSIVSHQRWKVFYIGKDEVNLFLRYGTVISCHGTCLWSLIRYLQSDRPSTWNRRWILEPFQVTQKNKVFYICSTIRTKLFAKCLKTCSSQPRFLFLLSWTTLCIYTDYVSFALVLSLLKSFQLGFFVHNLEMTGYNIVYSVSEEVFLPPLVFKSSLALLGSRQLHISPNFSLSNFKNKLSFALSCNSMYCMVLHHSTRRSHTVPTVKGPVVFHYWRTKSSEISLKLLKGRMSW